MPTEASTPSARGFTLDVAQAARCTNFSSSILQKPVALLGFPVLTATDVVPQFPKMISAHVLLDGRPI
jgi:hypothetical protein